MIKAKDLALISLFTALIAIGAFIQIPVPYVPITLQTAFVMMSGILLGSKKGALSVFIYIVLGLSGIPIFTKGGGIWYVIQPTFGYIIGFLVASFVIGVISEKVSKPTFMRLLIANIIGTMIIYIFGMAYFWIISKLFLNNDIGFYVLIVNFFLVTIAGDIITCVFTAYLCKKILPIKNKIM